MISQSFCWDKGFNGTVVNRTCNSLIKGSLEIIYNPFQTISYKTDLKMLNKDLKMLNKDLKMLNKDLKMLNKNLNRNLFMQRN